MLSETSSQQFNKTEEMIWSANPCAVRVPKLQFFLGQARLDTRLVFRTMWVSQTPHN